MVLLASSFDQSRFFRADDLTEAKTLRIKGVTEETIGNDQQSKLVVSFTNSKKGLVLNKINNRTIRGAYGDDTDGWKDKLIELFPTTTDMRGKQVPCLRVRIPLKRNPKITTGSAAKPAPVVELLEPEPDQPDFDDEIDF